MSRPLQSASPGPTGSSGSLLLGRGPAGALSANSPGVLGGGLGASPRLGSKDKLLQLSPDAHASHAALQSKLKAQLKAAEELRAAALAPPPQRTREQVEVLCSFLSSAHLLRHLQPTNIKTLAQTMAGSAWRDGEAIYRQGEAAKTLYVVLLGEVVMYERDEQQPASSDESSSSGAGANSSAAAPANSSGGGRHGGGSSGTRHGGPAGKGSKLDKQPTLAAAGWPVAGTSATDGYVEVRRVGPREMLGASEPAAGCGRLQTAVAGCATSTTFLAPAADSVAAAAVGGAATASSSSSSSSSSAREARRRSGGAPVAPGAASSGATVVLQLSADDYGAVLEGRLSAMLEEKVSFLAELPALKGLSTAYLRSLSHCFHQVEFEPKEVLVRQGDISDSMYVLKSGQVCVLIDLNMTLAESSSNGGAAAPSPTPPADGSAGELDLRKLVQVCLLGAGSIIGDMSVVEAAGPPRRSATVVALTDLLTYKVPLREFKRRMPAEVLEAMRRVANQKLVMNEQQATSRSAAAAAGLAGHVLLGGAVVPEAVLRGRGLRALGEAVQQAGDGGSGLVDALQQYLAGSGGSNADNGGSSPKAAGGNVTSSVTSSRAQQVEAYVSGLLRSGCLAAPPEQFLALMTDWRSARSATASPAPGDRKLPLEFAFPLPIPKSAPMLPTTGAAALQHAGSPPPSDGAAAAGSAAGQQQRPASRSKPLRDSLDQLVLPQQQQQRPPPPPPASQPLSTPPADGCSSSVIAAAAAGAVAAAVREASQQLDAPCCGQQQQQLSPTAGGGFRGRLAKPAHSPRQPEHEQQQQQALCVGSGGASAAVAKRGGGGRAAGAGGAALPGRLRSAASSPELLRDATVAAAAAGLLGGGRRAGGNGLVGAAAPVCGGGGQDAALPPPG